MLRVSFRRIKPEKEAQLRAWFAVLSTRADEVRATFVDETVRHEQAFILQTGEGPVLVYAVEAEDFERGRAAFAQSMHPIDNEHKKLNLLAFEPSPARNPLLELLQLLLVQALCRRLLRPCPQGFTP